MKTKTAFFGVLVAVGTQAAELTAADLRERLEIHADVYATDASGNRIVEGPLRTNVWRMNPKTGELQNDWSSDFDTGIMALRQHWSVDNSGVLHATIEQYAKAEGPRSDPKFTQLVKKKDFVVKNFEPIVWTVDNFANPNLVVRYIPVLREVLRPLSVDNLPIAGQGIAIADNEGYLWVDNLEFNGKYVGVTTHRGTLVLSYSPFRGGSDLGVAEGNTIKITVDKSREIRLKARDVFLPGNVTAKVYVAYLPNKRSKGFNSVHSFDTSKEERLAEILKK